MIDIGLEIRILRERMKPAGEWRSPSWLSALQERRKSSTLSTAAEPGAEK